MQNKAVLEQTTESGGKHYLGVFFMIAIKRVLILVSQQQSHYLSKGKEMEIRTPDISGWLLK